MDITIKITDEITALWLSELFKQEAEQAQSAASNEKLFALGSDGEEAEQHTENATANLAYAELLKDAYEQVQKYWHEAENAA